jgi:outer membrane lipoprotein-sorting protein
LFPVRSPHRRLAALALLTLCLACPRRIDFGREGEITDPAQLLALTAAAEARISGVKGEAKLTVELPQGKVPPVTLFVAAARPDLLHLESLDFFGRPQAVIVTDGKSFYLAQEGQYYRGPATAANVARAFPLALAPRALVGLLLGGPPMLSTENANLAVDGRAGAYVLTVRQEARTQTLWIHPRNHRVLRSVVRGGEGYEVSFDELQEVGTVVFPRRVVVDAPAARVHLELRYTDVTFNEEPDPALFSTEPPEGVPVIEVGEDGQPKPRAPDPAPVTDPGAPG